MSVPVDKKLYNKTKHNIFKKFPKHSAYRSGHLVKIYKKLFTKNMVKKDLILEKNLKKRIKPMV